MPKQTNCMKTTFHNNELSFSSIILQLLVHLYILNNLFTQVFISYFFFSSALFLYQVVKFVSSLLFIMKLCAVRHADCQV